MPRQHRRIGRIVGIRDRSLRQRFSTPQLGLLYVAHVKNGGLLAFFYEDPRWGFRLVGLPGDDREPDLRFRGPAEAAIAWLVETLAERKCTYQKIVVDMEFFSIQVGLPTIH